MKLHEGLILKTEEDYNKFIEQIQKDCESGMPHPSYKITYLKNGHMIVTEFIYYVGW